MDHATNHCHGHCASLLVLLYLVDARGTSAARTGSPKHHPRPTFARLAIGSNLPGLITVIAVFVALGHSVLAMSGAESLAQVYREIEYPKLPNLKKAALVIFLYSLIFTSLVSFFAVMIIPDKTRPEYFQNLISGLAMNLAGPYLARLAFLLFVVAVGTLILSGAVNTAIIGSNGVLNRVSEDGVLSDWFL